MKERIDIERLLEWAYRVQCVDRVAATVFSPRGPSGDANGAAVQMMQLGCRVDNSSAAARVLGAKAPDDALIVHDAVLALDEMWIEWTDANRIEIWDRARAGRVGQTIERRGGIWYREPVYSPGLVTPMPVRLEQACITALLIIHAKGGSRPEYHEGWKAGRGQVAKDAGDVDRWGRKRKRREGPSIEEVMHARALYLVWRAALAVLVADLAGALADYDATGPAASAEPWNEKG